MDELNDWLGDGELGISPYDMKQIIMKLLALKLITVDGAEEYDEMEMTKLGKEIILSTVKF